MKVTSFAAALLGSALAMSIAVAQTPPPAPAPGTPAPAPSTPAPAPAETTDQKLQKAFGESESFKTFFTALQTAVKAEDEKAVAALVSYPFKTKVEGVDTTFDDAKALVKAYGDVFRPSVAAAITAQTWETLTVNAAGVAIGSGHVWFKKVGEGADAKVLIIAVNPAAGT